jgi:rRNA-processing protein FCF1
MLVASLDANVLVPIVSCDFLLTAFDLGLYEPIVSTTVLEEIERALAEDFPRLDIEAICRRVAAMRAVLADQTLDGDTTDAPATVNAKDRHIVVAARHARAQLIVTNDRRLRDEIAGTDIGVRAVDLDAFGWQLWESSPAAVTRVIDDLVRKRRRRPVTRSEMWNAIGTHMPRLASVGRMTKC